MNLSDLPENSDSSDEDYIPETSTANNLPSEEDSDGDVEDSLQNSDEISSPKSKKRRKKGVSSKKRRTKSPSPVKKTEETQSTDDLWADFKKDTGFKTRAERQLNIETHANSSKPATISKTTSSEIHSNINATQSPKTVKVTEVYKFAGEEVKVEKDVDVASASKIPSFKRGGTSGINAILSNLGKKNKISTLEKSKLDWDKFKKDEDIEDELQAYSKSKDGYLERQDFLQRADLRRFEIEKGIRSNLRSNRLNNV